MPPSAINASRRYLPSSTCPACDGVIIACSSTEPSSGHIRTVLGNCFPHCGQRVSDSSVLMGCIVSLLINVAGVRSEHHGGSAGQNRREKACARGPISAGGESDR